jgi:integrase
MGLLYNKIVKALMNLRLLVSYPSIKEQNITLDFFEFAKTYIENMQNCGRKKSSVNYEVAVRNLAKFLGRDVNLGFNEMTSTFRKSYCDWMKICKLGARGQELYLTSIRSIFNEALATFNDYEAGEILIRTNPFKDFKIPKSEFISLAEKRALPVDTLKKIFSAVASSPREELARDIFLLRFCLCGMNAKDLYTCELIKGSQLIYHRSKTKGRGLKNSEMHINIPIEALGLLEKYRVKAENSKHVFLFSERYSTPDGFTSAINIGLKRINENLGLNLPELSLYYARHSWATIAVNDVHLSDELVDECLAHAPVYKMLRKYVKRTWTRVDETNRKVLDYVFYGKTPPEGSGSIWHSQM